MSEINWTIEIDVDWGCWWKHNRDGKEFFNYPFIKPVKISIETDKNLKKTNELEGELYPDPLVPYNELIKVIRKLNQVENDVLIYGCRIMEYNGNKRNKLYYINNTKIELNNNKIKIEYKDCKVKTFKYKSGKYSNRPEPDEEASILKKDYYRKKRII